MSIFGEMERHTAKHVPGHSLKTTMGAVSWLQYQQAQHERRLQLLVETINVVNTFERSEFF